MAEKEQGNDIQFEYYIKYRRDTAKSNIDVNLSIPSAIKSMLITVMK